MLQINYGFIFGYQKDEDFCHSESEGIKGDYRKQNDSEIEN